MSLKSQKTWLYIFTAMFLLPEVVWGNLIKIFNIPFLPIRNRDFFSDNPQIGFFVIAIEIFGILGLFFVNKKTNNSKNGRVWINFILIVIFLLLLLSLYLSYGVSRFSL